MVKYRIEITNVAEKDIIDIARYVAYELLDRDAADNLVDEFYDTIFSLIDMLKRHKTIEDNDQIIPKGIRRVGVKNYDIYYSCSDEDGIIYIRRVLYGKREWQKFI